MRISGKYLAHSSNFVIKSSLDSYPSRIKEKELEQLIKDRYKIKNDIILGNGSNALLQNIIKILFSKCEKANLVTPFYTFDQAEYGVTSVNCKTKRIGIHMIYPFLLKVNVIYFLNNLGITLFRMFRPKVLVTVES